MGQAFELIAESGSNSGSGRLPILPTSTSRTVARGIIEAAETISRQCHLCEHRCGVNRMQGELGFCRATSGAKVFRHRVEYGEELELVPSHLFYLSGCDLRCCFCIGGEISEQPELGQTLNVPFFAEAVAWGRQQGAKNLQWVGGEPTIHLPAILKVMSQAPNLPPIVWKSNFHATPEAFELLAGIVDIYVADFKFGNHGCAERLAGVTGYWETVTRNLLIAAGQGDLIVRHLLLPGHFDCCYRPIIAWMREHLRAAKINLRDGYLPSWHASRCSELTIPLDAATAQRARKLAQEAGLNMVV